MGAHRPDDYEALTSEIRKLNKDVTELKQQLSDHANTLKTTKRRIFEPSFLKSLEAYKQFIAATAGDKRFDTLPIKGMTSKLAAYAHIASHGIKIPRVLKVWPRLSQVSLESLPDEFVMKSDGGSTSHGVLPVRRIHADRFEVVDGSRSLSADQLLTHFETSFKAGTSYGMMFAEELLVSSNNQTGVPDDVKLYMAYGEVLQILLRSVDVHGNLSHTRSKYVDQNGKDLGAIASHRDIDSSIPVPAKLPKMTEIAKHLSHASGLPFCRIDLYDTTNGVIVGEVTRAPGGAQTYTPEHDAEMGTQWHLAEARLMIDYQAGRPIGTLDGTNPLPAPLDSVYPFLTIPGRQHVVDCETWCER